MIACLALNTSHKVTKHIQTCQTQDTEMTAIRNAAQSQITLMPSLAWASKILNHGVKTHSTYKPKTPKHRSQKHINFPGAALETR